MSETNYNLTGRAAVITGANRGLGREIAAHFVRAGASVLLTARDEALLREVGDELAPQANAPGQQVKTLGGDVSDPAHCDEAARLREQLPGDAPVLVNNAGVYG